MAPPTGPVPAQGPSRLRRWRYPLLALLVVLLALATCAGVVLQQAASARPRTAAPVVTLPATLTVPGQPPAIPWPDGASAALDVPGIGRLPGQASDRPVPIASVTKVMTALLVLRAHPLGADEPGPLVPVTDVDVADYRSRLGTGQSLVPLAVGQALTERQALEALLVPSANDVATLLARWVSGSVPAFVQAMNDTARELGMRNTTYTDPSGFDASTVSSADDQVRLAEVALAQPALADVVAMPSVDVPGAGRLRNYNALLGELGVVGVKTGSTYAAAGNLVFAAKRTVAGREVTFVGAVLGAGRGRASLDALDQAIAASRAALTAAQAAVREVEAVPSGTPVGGLPVPWAEPVQLRTSSALSVLGWPGLTAALRVETAALTPGAAGREAGRLVVALPGAPEQEVPVSTADAVPQPSLWWRVQRQLDLG